MKSRFVNVLVSLSLMVVASPLISLAESTTPPISGKALEIHNEFMRNLVLYDDPKLQAYVQELGELMVQNSSHAGRDYYFFVVDSEGVNAVTPGYGLVYVYRGLLTLLNSEAELAGVLAHEIGHNLGNHRGDTIRDITLGNIGAFVAGILTGSGSIYNSVGLANQERQAKARRERELEADAFAGEILYEAQYDPAEFLTALGALKDNSTFMSQYGGQGVSYHGTFASHPRSDKRLQEVIRQAGELPPGEATIGRERWRKMIDGLVIGPNYNGNKTPDQERYISEPLGITFVYPKTWSLSTKGAAILLKDAAKTVQLKIVASKVPNPVQPLSDVLASKLAQVGAKDKPEVVAIVDADKNEVGLIGAHGSKRIAIKRVGRHDYYFEGIAKDNSLSATQDAAVVSIIQEFRRISSNDLPPESITKIYFHRLQPGETFASLAEELKSEKYGEQSLRLINGYFPRGEAEPGTWIKMYK